MEKKLLCVFALGTMALAMASCGNGKSDNQTSSTDTVQQAVQPEKPYADSPSSYAQSVKLGGQEFVISITRKADPGQPIVTDELGKQFYDNRVEVNITSNGRDFFHHSYTREAFEDFLHENEKQGTVLLGMAYDPEKSDGHAIRLGAQVGQVGIGEGPAFTVEIPLDGGASSIVRDRDQDTTRDDGLSD